MEKFAELTAKFDEWQEKQSIPVQSAVKAFLGGAQGLGLGFVTGSFAENAMKNAPPGQTNPFTQPGMTQPSPLAQGRNFGVLLGVQYGLGHAIKKYRGGVDDVYGAMGAAFGSGVAFSLVSGIPDQAITYGMGFALFQGLFFQIGKATGGGDTKEEQFAQGNYLLQGLGLDKYQKNLKRGVLTDNTIMLWNDRALQEVKIPPGPRLLILHQIDQYRAANKSSDILKPALPVAPAN